jgi:hypothetical protein
MRLASARFRFCSPRAQAHELRHVTVQARPVVSDLHRCRCVRHPCVRTHGVIVQAEQHVRRRSASGGTTTWSLAYPQTVLQRPAAAVLVTAEPRRRGMITRSRRSDRSLARGWRSWEQQLCVVGVSQGCARPVVARRGGRRRITRMAARAAVGWSWSAGGGSDEATAGTAVTAVQEMEAECRRRQRRTQQTQC